MKKHEVNSAEIARRVGVSRSTVSKVINNYPNISERTREQVWAAIQKYGYYPNHSARTMAGKRTDTIALFLAGPGRFAQDMLVDVMLATMIESAAECGYHMLTYIVRNPESAESARTIKEVFHQRRIDGGVFVGFANNIPVVEELVTDGFPVGVFDHTSRGHVYPNRAVANFDDERVAGRAIDYLVGLGHRRIAVIHGDRKRNAGEGRYKGFSLALERNGIKPDDKWIMYGDFGRDNGRTLAGRLLADRSDLPTAVAAVNDAVAFGVIDAASEAGVVVPHELSVIGIDGHPLGPYTTPSLTTFSYDLRAMFRSLVKTVTEIAEGSEPYELHQVFSGTFTERGSCAPPASSID